PDFYNRNTIQIWDASNYTEIKVNKWKGATLTDRTIHEITIVNNSNTEVEIDFNGIYILSDEETIGAGGLPVVVIGANETAYFYATALIHEGNLEMNFRTGSQDTRK
ncbi:MAG: hypothetical protein KAH32_03085, partial [Chlamydiia bacterium]|nr:hypothetical protein [Chlamydiia bacterium]